MAQTHGASSWLESWSPERHSGWRASQTAGRAAGRARRWRWAEPPETITGQAISRYPGGGAAKTLGLFCCDRRATRFQRIFARDAAGQAGRGTPAGARRAGGHPRPSALDHRDAGKLGSRRTGHRPLRTGSCKWPPALRPGFLSRRPPLRDPLDQTGGGVPLTTATTVSAASILELGIEPETARVIGADIPDRTAWTTRRYRDQPSASNAHGTSLSFRERR